MPDDARRDAAFYDHENEPRRHVADWGADDLFTRMPRRRTVHTPPPPRARRPAPIDPAHRPGPDAAGRFERLDGEAPSAGDVLPSSGRFARPPIQDGPRAEPPADGGFAFPDRGSRPGDDSASERRPTSSGGSGLRATGSSGRTAPANGDPAGDASAGTGADRRAGASRDADATPPARGAVDDSGRGAPRGAAIEGAHAVDAAGGPSGGGAGGGSSEAPDGRWAEGVGWAEGGRWADAVDGRWGDAAHGRWSEAPGGRWGDAAGARWANAADGRRTVVISGRPDGVARLRPERHRPPKTVAERLGPRPERIVGWAFALGLLLILIAILTANTGTV